MKTKICAQCQEQFKQYTFISGKFLSLSGRKFCLKCSPYKSYAKSKKPILDGLRECGRCKTFKPINEFQLRGKTKYLRANCIPCETQRVKEYGQKLKQKSIEYLGGKCIHCGYNRCSRSLNFHHLDPTKKKFSLGKKKLLKWETVKVELDKCVLVCANCHGEIHDGLISL